jgi:hypothetical protein
LVFLKAAGILKLNSYWFKRIQKAAIEIIKEFPKAAIGHFKGFPKAFVFVNIFYISS